MASIPKGVDLKALQVFQAVCQSATLAKAARRLAMTQPAVSQHLTRLENAIGALLLERSQRPFRLTPAGEVLRERVDGLLQDVSRTVTAVRTIGQAPLPSLRISIPTSLSNALAPTLFAELKRHPSPRSVHISCDNALELSRRFLEREIDLIVSADPLDDVDGLGRHPLCRESYMLVLPSKYTGRVDNLQELAEQIPFIRFAPRSTIAMAIDRHLARVGIEIARHASFDSASVVTSVVGQGDGFSIMTPLCLFEGRANRREVVSRSLPIAKFHRTLSLISRTQEQEEIATAVANAARKVLKSKICSRLNSLVGADVASFEVLG